MHRVQAVLFAGLVVTSIASGRFNRCCCTQPDDDDDSVGYAKMTSAANGAFAGVGRDQLCVDYNYQEEDETYTLITWPSCWTCTNTSFRDDSANGCDFSDRLCTDPTMRQQLIQTNACTLTGTNQQIVDGLMIQLNRPNWLYAYPVVDTVIWPDDHLCMFRRTIDNVYTGYVVAAFINSSICDAAAEQRRANNRHCPHNRAKKRLH